MFAFELTPQIAENLATEFRSALGGDWLDQCLRELRFGVAPRKYGEGAALLVGLANLPETIAAMLLNHTPRHYREFVVFGWTAHTIQRAFRIAGGGQLIKEMAAILRVGGAAHFSRFYDLVFEAEVAVYFSDAQGAQSVRIETSPHPDLWVTGSSSRTGVPNPVECKRVSPIGETKQPWRQLRRNLKKAVGQLQQTSEWQSPGIAAVRIRPPESTEELLAVDRVVRDELARHNQPLLGFVELFWNASEDIRGPWLFEPSGTPRRTVLHGYQLVPYRILNAHCSRPLSPHDSRDIWFPERTHTT